MKNFRVKNIKQNVQFNLDIAAFVGVPAPLIVDQSIVGCILCDPLAIKTLDGCQQLSALDPILPLQFERYR